MLVLFRSTIIMIIFWFLFLFSFFFFFLDLFLHRLFSYYLQIGSSFVSPVEDSNLNTLPSSDLCLVIRAVSVLCTFTFAIS